jgi:hypothetical protein
MTSWDKRVVAAGHGYPESRRVAVPRPLTPIGGCRRQKIRRPRLRPRGTRRQEARHASLEAFSPFLAKPRFPAGTLGAKGAMTQDAHGHRCHGS